MDPAEYHTIYTVEDRHWWYVGMRHITLALLNEAYGRRTDLRISYLALPGKSFAADWNPFVFSLGVPIATVIAARFSITPLM